jgi:lauroyl/myristoyl acyltransferase
VQLPGDDEDAAQQLTQAIFTAHERFIRRRPAQWFMFREMWPEHTKEQ